MPIQASPHTSQLLTNDNPLCKLAADTVANQGSTGAQGAGLNLNGSNGRHYARVHVAGSHHEETMWPFVLSQAEGHSKDGLSAQIR
jgi:hypothetical protein